MTHYSATEYLYNLYREQTLTLEYDEELGMPLDLGVPSSVFQTMAAQGDENGMT